LYGVGKFRGGAYRFAGFELGGFWKKIEEGGYFFEAKFNIFEKIL